MDEQSAARSFANKCDAEVKDMCSRLLNPFDSILLNTHLTEIGQKVEAMQLLWIQAVTFAAFATLGNSQVQYTIDAKSDNSFFHELISPSISNSNTKQNMYSRFGSAVGMATDMVVIGADNNGECTLASNCNLVNTASVTSCDVDGVFSCATDNDCWFRVGAKVYFEQDGSNSVFCGVIVGLTYFVLESNGATFTVSACQAMSATTSKKSCAAESARYRPGGAASGLMIASSHSGEGSAFIFERNLPHVTNPTVYVSMLNNPPAATFSDQDCVPQYVTVVVINSATVDDSFTISATPETFGCKYCVKTTANFVIGRPVYFSAVNFFGGVTSVPEGVSVFSGSFIIGMVYTIETMGSDPRFTSIGASNNNVGTTFVATGTGDMGTGSAIMQPYKIHSKPSSSKFTIRKSGSDIADLTNSPPNAGFMTATTSIETCVPVRNVWGFRRQLLAPEEDQQYIQANIPINKQGDRFGAAVWIDADSSTTSPNNPVVIVGAPMKKQDNPTEFVITAIKSEHYTYYRPSLEPELTSFKFRHTFMCSDCQVYVGDKIVFTGTMPACVPTESGLFGARVGVSIGKIYYVAGVVKQYNPSGTFAPQGFQLAYTLDGAEVKHPNELYGMNGGEDSWENSANTGLVTVGTCAEPLKESLSSSTPNGADPPPLYTYDPPKTLGCQCVATDLKMRIVRVHAAGGAYIWEKVGNAWTFKTRLSIIGHFTPLQSNVLWEKSYFGTEHQPSFFAQPVIISNPGAAVSISAKHKLAFAGCPGCTRMRGRIRQESTGALWVFAPVAGNWNELGYQILTHNNINGKSRTEFGNAVAYSTTYSILAVAAFNDQNDKFNNGYNLKNHGSVYLYTRQNTIAPASTTTPHTQFVYLAKLQATDNSYVEYQRNCFGRMLHFSDRMIYVGAGRSQLDKVYAFMLTAGTSFNLHKIYLTDSAQWYENTAFAVATNNPTSMITTHAGCNTGKCDDTRDLNRPTFYGLPFCSDGETAVVGNVNIEKTGIAYITSKDLVTIFHTPICMTFATPWQWEYNFANAG